MLLTPRPLRVRLVGPSIKLGLGDFIFYSVLASKAASYSLLTCVSCVSTILFGLAATMVLLSVQKRALPALPISVFLGVAVYLATRYMAQPWVEAMMRCPIFV